jgi:hypothetical protein
MTHASCFQMRAPARADLLTADRSPGMKEHHENLSKIVSEIYAGDEYASNRAK